MSKKIYNVISLALLAIAIHTNIVGWDIYSLDKNIFVGNILFPQDIKNIPQISLYQRGLKIQSDTDNSGKKIQFTISEDKKCKQLHFLITRYVKAKIENNTVKHLKIDKEQKYKLYTLAFVEAKDFSQWEIKEQEIGNQGMIPDDTLIVIFNPDYIEKIEGGNNFELPKICIKHNILELAGSEEKLHDEMNELLMASLDLNILHIKPTSEIKSDHKKKLIIAMSNPD